MKDKDNLQKRIQQKLKNKLVGKVILCETLIASIAIPTMIYVNRPVYAKMEKTITKEKTVERTLNQNEDLQDTSLTIKSTWQLNNNQQYERTYINYNVADLKEEEIQELINNEDVLMDFIIKNKGTSGVETKTTLTEEEQNNNQIDISAHYYYVDENHQIKEDKTVKNVVNVMTNEFPTGSGKKTYADCIFLEKMEQKDYDISDEFDSMLQNPDFYRILKELVEFGISRYKENYSHRYQDTSFVLYQKYTYEDVCRLLEWENNEVPLNLGGYKYDRKTKTFPVFINYDKEEDIQDTIKYEDHFVSPNRLIAISKQSRTKDSEDVQNFLHAQERGIDVELFVRKNKDDKISKEFYYLGRMKATGQATEFIMANTDKTAVEIEWELETPVREDIYEYIVNN